MSTRETEVRHTRKGKRKKAKLSRVLLLTLGIICLGAFLFLCGYTVNAYMTLPPWDPSKLSGAVSTVIYDKLDHPASSVYAEENRSPISLAQMPPFVPGAFVAAEDNRFYEHGAIDIQGIARALVANIRGGYGSEGASTITQQLVKLSFLSPQKTTKRKLQEAMLAMKVERSYTKDEILEFYLNRVYFGNGAYGIQTASQLYFGKDAKNLDIAQAAMLAGIVRSPNNYNPFGHPENATARQILVLNQMTTYGKISSADETSAKAEKISFQSISTNATYPYPYYTDQVISETETVLIKQGMTKETAQNLIYHSGLKIYTSLNTKVQEKMEATFADNSLFPPNQNGKQVQGAMVVLDQHTGEVQALVGGREYTVQRSFNRATQAKRQPGSAIKPIVVYSPALEKGYTTAQVEDDVPATFGSKTFYDYDNHYRGLITMRTAVQYSINTYAVKLLSQIGPDYGYEFAKKMGITSLDPVRDRNLSLGLGGVTVGISPWEMAGAYGTIANTGVYVQPHAIRKIVDNTGQTIYEVKPQQQVALSEQTSYIMTNLLQTVVKAGTGTRAQLGNRPVAGKTGTTSEDVDTWFMGYTPEYTASVWMGFDKEERMYNVAGGDKPARIWKQVMQTATANLPVRSFPQPSGIVHATVCTKSGLLPNAFCPAKEKINEIFVQGTVPRGTCNVHVQAQICADTGQLATPYCPNKITKVFLKRPRFPSGYTPADAAEASPTQFCTLHGPGAAASATNIVKVQICTDPLHNGQPVLANVHGLLESGGCPPEFVVVKEFPANQVPTEYCNLTDHQVQKIKSLKQLFTSGHGKNKPA
jgi:penicillin-binding protein 1A